MTGNNNKKWIVICLGVAAIIAVILAVVLAKSCSNSSEDTDKDSTTEVVTVSGKNTENTYSEEHSTYNEESIYSEESISKSAIEEQTEPETTDIVEDNWDKVIEDEFTSGEEVTEEDTMQSQESTLQSESNTIAESEVETVQEETGAQYDGIVLPDDIF